MTAREWGALDDAGTVGGDAQLGPAWCRAFLTETPAGYPCVVTVYAYAALVNPGDDDTDPAARRDMLVQTDVSTYLHGADPTDPGAEPFDSETDYTWPVDYWPARMLDDTGEPSVEACDRAARGYLRTLPTAWIDAMPTPTYPTPALEA